MALVRIHPFQYIHVLDNNTNTKRVEVGPQTFSKQNHEEIVQASPLLMNIIPPRYYVKIKDPYVRASTENKDPVTDKYGQAQIRHGDYEIRFHEDFPEPFFLYPGESIVGSVTKLEIILDNDALRLRAERDFTDEEKVDRVAGDEWLFKGPGTYKPRVQEKIIEHVKAKIINKGFGLKIQARKAFVDRSGISRDAGECWMVRETGAYLPHVDATVLQEIEPISLKRTRAVHLKALNTFVDAYGINRKAGEEWLVTFKMSETHMLNVSEYKVKEVNITMLSKTQWCIILDPVGEDGKIQYGKRQLRKGATTFFLLPGERLESGIRSSYVLSESQGLLVKANEKFIDNREEKPIERSAGMYWMVVGPAEYIPTVESEVVETRNAIPLDKNEGIYVRDYASGDIRAQTGCTYMLKAAEVLWEKDLPHETEMLIQSTKFSDDEGFGRDMIQRKRDKTRVVIYRVPHNSAVQIYDYKARSSRVVVGPELVMLQPDEQFTVLSLSGKLPKRPNEIKTIAVRLGPDFMTDVIEVETMDHARLRLKMAYNWFFNIKEKTPENYAQIFVVRDFVGDCCKAIASLVRGAAASTAFDVFHKHSAELIRTAVFGKDENGKIKNAFEFMSNQLCITNIDIQSVEPIDESTRESLMKSVQLAIEITAQKQERVAKHHAQKTEQTARGQIDKQKIINQKNAESDRKEFIELQSLCKEIEQSGSAEAEARARAQAGAIKGKLEVDTAKLMSTATEREAQATLADTIATQQREIEYKEALAKLEIKKSKDLSLIESTKFSNLVRAIGTDTIKKIARAGPETQALLLKGLGLKGYLMTDGNSPINLFNAAKGMVGQ